MASSETADAAKKPPRILACTLCQSRKVRCDRNFPCSNCVQAQQKCIPASYNPRQRRRRFAERDLLGRLRHYEDLLRRNNIVFEPMHSDGLHEAVTDGHDGTAEDRETTRAGSSGASRWPAAQDALAGPRTAYEADDIWKIWGAKDSRPSEATTEEHERERDSLVRRAWDQLYQQQQNSHLIFGLGAKNTDLSTLHPKPAHMMKLFQIFLDNVNSLLKVVHVPSLQPRFIDATASLTTIGRDLEALMFSIYCIAVFSMSEEDCLATFQMTRQALLRSFQFACQEALLNCGFLRSSSHECLTALHLYLISFDTIADPRSLSAMLGVALRIAQRIAIHDEAANTKRTPFEAEMRRRLWWSLVMFDNRVGELSNNKAAMLGPAWDCKPPANISDYDLRPEMKDALSDDSRPTEALFAVVRSRLMDHIRHSQFHLDFTRATNADRLSATPSKDVMDLDTFEKTLEDNCFKLCSEDNSLHVMTINMVRGYLAKCHLLEQRSNELQGMAKGSTTNRESVIGHAVQMLECDTKLMTSPLTKGYIWLVQDYLPFPGYMNIVQELQREPLDKDADRMWQAMSENYQARHVRLHQANNLFLKYLGKTILRAWEATEVATKQKGKTVEEPQIVLDIKHNLNALEDAGTIEPEEQCGVEQFVDRTNVARAGFDIHSEPYLANYSGLGLFDQETMFEQSMSGFDITLTDWTSIFGM